MPSGPTGRSSTTPWLSSRTLCWEKVDQNQEGEGTLQRLPEDKVKEKPPAIVWEHNRNCQTSEDRVNASSDVELSLRQDFFWAQSTNPIKKRI